jgi:alkanesulfonate monooxygenase SsuD/methylene tetrahydromethanopterin reductase-like flavin-dependent oxidoreductase (luciferase family)
MARMKFGAFLAPHHPIGEHPMLQFRSDLDLVDRLDKLGFDEFWCGEHGGTVLLSLNAGPDGVLFEYLDENMQNGWTLTIAEYVAAWERGSVHGERPAGFAAAVRGKAASESVAWV